MAIYIHTYWATKAGTEQPRQTDKPIISNKTLTDDDGSILKREKTFSSNDKVIAIFGLIVSYLSYHIG